MHKFQFIADLLAGKKILKSDHVYIIGVLRLRKEASSFCDNL